MKKMKKLATTGILLFALLFTSFFIGGYAETEAATKVTVNQITTSSKKVTVKVTASKKLRKQGMKIKVKVNGKTYTKTIKSGKKWLNKGKASITIGKQKAGTKVKVIVYKKSGKKWVKYASKTVKVQGTSSSGSSSSSTTAKKNDTSSSTTTATKDDTSSAGTTAAQDTTETGSSDPIYTVSYVTDEELEEQEAAFEAKIEANCGERYGGEEAYTGMNAVVIYPYNEDPNAENYYVIGDYLSEYTGSAGYDDEGNYCYFMKIALIDTDDDSLTVTYTTDGSRPTMESTKVDGSVRFAMTSETPTVKIHVYKGGNLAALYYYTSGHLWTNSGFYDL